MNYQSYLDDERRKSRILNNPTDADMVHGAAVDLSTRQRVEALIREYDDEAEGLIPAAQAQVDTIEGEFHKHANQQRALGWPAPENMPSEMQQRHDRARARLQVLREERDKLEEIRDSFDEEQERDRRAAILKAIGGLSYTTEPDPIYGMRTSIDRQKLALVRTSDGAVLDMTFNPRDRAHLDTIPADSLAVILDEQSPFNGLSLGDYRAYVVEPLKSERKQKREQLLADNHELPQERQEPDEQLITRARQYRPPWMTDWPEGCKCWLAEGADAEAAS